MASLGGLLWPVINKLTGVRVAYGTRKEARAAYTQSGGQKAGLFLEREHGPKVYAERIKRGVLKPGATVATARSHQKEEQAAFLRREQAKGRAHAEAVAELARARATARAIEGTGKASSYEVGLLRYERHVATEPKHPAGWATYPKASAGKDLPAAAGKRWIAAAPNKKERERRATWWKWHAEQRRLWKKLYNDPKRPKTDPAEDPLHYHTN